MVQYLSNLMLQYLLNKIVLIMGDYCAPARGTMEIMCPKGHIMPPEGCIMPTEGYCRPEVEAA